MYKKGVDALFRRAAELGLSPANVLSMLISKGYSAQDIKDTIRRYLPKKRIFFGLFIVHRNERESLSLNLMNMLKNESEQIMAEIGALEKKEKKKDKKKIVLFPNLVKSIDAWFENQRIIRESRRCSKEMISLLKNIRSLLLSLPEEILIEVSRKKDFSSIKKIMDDNKITLPMPTIERSGQHAEKEIKKDKEKKEDKKISKDVKEEKKGDKKAESIEEEFKVIETQDNTEKKKENTQAVLKPKGKLVITRIDDLLKLIEKKKEIDLEDAVKQLNSTKEKITELSEILQEKGFIRIRYPLMGDTKLMIHERH